MGILEKISILMLSIAQICLNISIMNICKRIRHIEKRIERDEGHLWYYDAKVERIKAEKAGDNQNQEVNKQ